MCLCINTKTNFNFRQLWNMNLVFLEFSFTLPFAECQCGAAFFKPGAEIDDIAYLWIAATYTIICG